MSTGGFRDCIG